MKRNLTASKVKSKKSYKRKNKATRKHKKLNYKIKQKRNHRGSGSSSSKQRSNMSPLDELVQIENEYKNKNVYEKLIIIKKLSQSQDNTLEIDILINKKLSENDIKPELNALKIKQLMQLKNSLISMGANIEDTAIEKNELVDSLNRELINKTNVKVDKIFKNMITKKRNNIIQQLKEEEEKRRIRNLEIQRREEITRQENEKKRYEEQLKKQQLKQQKKEEEDRRVVQEFYEDIALAEAIERDDREREAMNRYYNPNTVHHFHHYVNPSSQYQQTYQRQLDAQRELNEIPEELRKGERKTFF
jgi:hypothetical protein